jgi:hypothetical protein
MKELSVAFNSPLLRYATFLRDGLKFMVCHALCFPFGDGVDGNDTTEDDAGPFRQRGRPPSPYGATGRRGIGLGPDPQV